MKTDAKTHADLNTPAFRQPRVTALQRELGEAMDILAATATVLTVEGVPAEVDGKVLGLPDRVRWLVAHGPQKELMPHQTREPYSNTPQGMSDAHADGVHAELPREGCSDCATQHRGLRFG